MDDYLPPTPGDEDAPDETIFHEDPMECPVFVDPLNAALSEDGRLKASRREWAIDECLRRIGTIDTALLGREALEKEFRWIYDLGYRDARPEGCESETLYLEEST